jgi:hypothetical protein
LHFSSDPILSIVFLFVLDNTRAILVNVYDVNLW